MTEIFLILVEAIIGIFLATVFFGAPYVPTHNNQLIKLFDYLKLDHQDVLVDLGSGDGRVLRSASPKVKRAIGYEINPILFIISKLLSISKSNIDLRAADFRSIKLPTDTTVVYIFFADRFKTQILRLINNHRQPVLVISYGYRIDELGTSEQKYGFWIYRVNKHLPKTKKSV